MELGRVAVERRVMSLMGQAIGGMDHDSPRADSYLF